MQNPNSIVLGIDPGISNTGWAVVKHAAGKYRYVDSCVILTHAHAPIGKRPCVGSLSTFGGTPLIDIDGKFQLYTTDNP